MFQDPVSSFTIGRKIPYGPVSVSKAEIIAFAKEYDPADFHIDELAAAGSMLNGLSASGFHTCSLTMRMICDAYLLGSTCQGSPGFDEINWLLPVRPGDTLKGHSLVNSARHSDSRTDTYLVNFTHETFNQNGEKVLSMTNTIFFKAEKQASNA